MKMTDAEVIRRVDVGRATFYRAKRLGFIEREKDGTWDLRKVRIGCEAMSTRRGGQHLKNNGGMALPPAFIAIKQAQAQEELELTRAKQMRAQQELAKEAGELILRADVLRGWGELMMNFRDALLAVGDQIALRCDGRRAREIASIVRSAHEEVLKQLAEGGGRFNGLLGRKAGAR